MKKPKDNETLAVIAELEARKCTSVSEDERLESPTRSNSSQGKKIKGHHEDG